MQIKGHKKSTHWEKPWPRKQINNHTEGKCPHCSKKVNNLEEHIRSRHMEKKKKELKGKVHGHD